MRFVNLIIDVVFSLSRFLLVQFEMFEICSRTRFVCSVVDKIEIFIIYRPGARGIRRNIS